MLLSASQAAQGVGLGQSVGVGQRGGGVGVLHDVVLGLLLARVAGEPTLLAQPVEAGGTAGEQLVDVGLVAGVEDDPVARGVEDPVDAERQLDDAEVAAQVTARPTHALDEEGTERIAVRDRLLGREGL